METYFDILPDDILLTLLKKERILKDVNDDFKKLFDMSVKLISSGLINPLEYFDYVYNDKLTIYTYCDDFDVVKYLDGSNVCYIG